jgi:DNA N-6-adenine-methyltransferase (Dam)
MAGRGGIGSHTAPNWGGTDDWITPRWLLDALPPFDLDPCAHPDQPWPTARRMVSPPGDGLAEEWAGRVWLNPPYGDMTGAWLGRLADHGDGVALVFARTETAAFHRHVWGRADAVLFLEGRLFFCRPSGKVAEHNAGGPSCLVAYGARNAEALAGSGLRGALAEGWRPAWGPDMPVQGGPSVSIGSWIGKVWDRRIEEEEP